MSNNIPSRLFLQSDFLRDDQLDRAQLRVRYILRDMGLPFIKEVFDKAVGYAWHDFPATWKLILAHDEIYADSSLYGLNGKRTYVGAPPLMDNMMQYAFEQKVTGKSLFFLTTMEEILWDNINLSLFEKVFSNNKLFCINSRRFEPVNIVELIKSYPNEQ